jgi:outer membrane immunogenic protein
MNRHFGWALALIASFGASQAMAADLAARPYTKAPPAVAAALYNWTGPYVGFNAGAVLNDTRDDIYPTGCFLTGACGGVATSNPLRSDSVRLNQVGFTGGVQGGYNWQRDRWVFGVEGDINYNGINDGSFINRPLAAPLAGNIVHTETDKLQWFGTLRGRAGVTATPNLLLYATGGLAFGQIKSASVTTFTLGGDTYIGSLDDTRVGWTVGGGGEWMVAPNWSIKGEYLYVDLGKAGYNQACVVACGVIVPPLSYQTDLRIREHIARFGVNYHFGATPVVAKY